MLYYFQIHLHHLLTPFSFWRPVVPLSEALLRCVPLPLARKKNSLRILAHSHLEIVEGTTAQFGGASGDVFSAICVMQISRFTSSKPSKFAFASDEKSIRQPTTLFVRCYLKFPF